MPKLFNPLRRGRGVIASAALASLALAAGALAAGAPSASASIKPDCVWNQLSLMNGWQSDQNTYSTGDPRYCVTKDGMVHVAGSLTQPGAGAGEFAVLPPQAWPASNLYLSVYTLDSTAGYLMIDTAGRMYAYSGPDGDAPGFTSLAGVSFPGTSVAQQPLALLNGWQSAQAQWGTGDPSYSVTNGVVHLSGSLNGSTITPGLWSDTQESTFAQLPQGARPDNCTGTEAYTYAGVPGVLQVDPLGMMYAYAQWAHIYNSPSAQYTSLAGVSYPVAGTVNWQALSLQSPWSAAEAQWCQQYAVNGPAWAVSGGVVYLTGWMIASPNGGEVTVLPPEARPTHTLYLTLNQGPAPHVSLEIQPNGAMSVFGNASANGADSLAGLSYELTS